LQPKV